MASQPAAPARDKTKGLLDSILNKAAVAAHAKLSNHLQKPSQHTSTPQQPAPNPYNASYIPPQPTPYPPPYTPQASHTPPNPTYWPPFTAGVINTTPPIENTLSVTVGIICPGCQVGLTPGDNSFHCQTCPDTRNIYCQTCHHQGRSCTHSPQQTRLTLVANDIKKKQYPKDELGFDYKCIGCKIRIKHLDFCWHCTECFSYPDTCQDCWKVKEKRCRHAGRKKIELRKVRDSGSESGVEDTLDALDAVFG